MRLNRKIEYALIAIKHLSSLDGGCLGTSREISDMYSIPFDMMAQVLRSLARGGVLKSDQGVRGGYSLSQDLESISLYDIHKIIMGPLYLAYCLNPETKACDIRSSCSIQKPVEKLNERFQLFLHSISVLELVQENYELSSTGPVLSQREVEGVS